MLKYGILLIFLCGIKISNSSQEDNNTDLKDISGTGIKKNEVGANGLDKSEDIIKNFRNPVLEYLLHRNPERTIGGPSKGITREIRHSQTLLIPNIQFLLPNMLNPWTSSQNQMKPIFEVSTNPENSPAENFWNYLKNKSQTAIHTANKAHESIVTSPVLHLNKNPDESKESTRVQVYPAMGVVINTFNKDGSLKNSVTHYQPDFGSVRVGAGKEKEGILPSHHTVGSFLGETQRPTLGEFQRQVGSLQQGGIPWPFANYFPIVINDPFLAVYNAVSTSMYNAVSSIVEYGPEADICRKKTDFENENNDKNLELPKSNKTFEIQSGVKPVLDRSQRNNENDKMEDSNFFGEITMRSEDFEKIKQPLKIEKGKLKRLETSNRKRRDTTSILLTTKHNDNINITLEEPAAENDINSNTQDEKARSFNPVFVNPPPLSTILRPPHYESRQFLGHADKKKKSKPSKPIKEEGSSEEVGEEHEEENPNEGQESANEAVAISPPPDGASVAEAKPIGLAIAGPGGVAASKPQGTAVAGPGGLAIARPVGTAIAGVDVEGSVPIGGQQKNKKKPKQEQEQTDTELHYVGGLTGPIGNPKPKEFADTLYYKSLKESAGNNNRDDLFFRGRHESSGYQLKLGQRDGKYGFVPMFASTIQDSDRLQKRMDSPTFFHGLLGNNAQENDQIQNNNFQF